jgi:hypothetical protein
MGRAARAHVEGRFNWDRTFQTLLGEVYPCAFETRFEAIRRSSGDSYARPTAA